jgi:hypothetical protein
MSGFLSVRRLRTPFAKSCRMIVWQVPSFEELAMNAEIGAYQPEPGDDDRSYEPVLHNAVGTQALAPVTSASDG